MHHFVQLAYILIVAKIYWICVNMPRLLISLLLLRGDDDFRNMTITYTMGYRGQYSPLQN